MSNNRDRETISDSGKRVGRAVARASRPCARAKRSSILPLALEYTGETPVPRNRARQRRGTILIVAMGIALILSAFVIIFARTMRIEMVASANRVAIAQASAVEKAGEQYAMAMLEDQATNDTAADFIFTLDDSQFAGIPVGENSGYFWFLRPDYGDDTMAVYGMVSESGKVNINTADVTDSAVQLQALPGMTPDVAGSIVDWRDADDTPSSAGGVESQYYLSLPNPYPAKNSDFETVEELLLVKGFNKAWLYGNGQGTTGATPSSSGAMATPSLSTDQQLDRGIYDLLTTVSIEPQARITTGSGRNATSTTVIPRGRINVNQAPSEVLACLPGLTTSDVSQMITQRANLSDPTDISWLSKALPGKDLTTGGPSGAGYVTGKTYQYSADIIAVSGNGRAFKRVRVIIDARSTPFKIIYRRDITERGWPLAPEILTSLRQGAGLPPSAYQPPPGRTQ
jgi:hypothetical protein